jgi:uncharacterized protein YjbI with pentapeptide repeats
VQAELGSNTLVSEELGARPLHVIVTLALTDKEFGYPIDARTRSRGVDFTMATLRGAHFDNAYVSEPAFVEAELPRASFRAALVLAATFHRANLRYADFTTAYVGRSEFQATCVSHARFVKANMSETLFYAEGRDVDLSGANVKGLRSRRSHGFRHYLTDVRAPSAVGDNRTRLPENRPLPDARRLSQADRRCLR